MLRLVILGAAVALAAPALAGGDPGYPRRGRYLPPEVAYRDPAYIPPPPLRPVLAAPVFVAPVLLAPRSLALPLYNEPPPRFPGP